MNRKGKGINGERELVRAFWEHGFACIRIAGSGASRFPTVDLVAGKGNRKLAIECKMTNDPAKYFNKDEILQATTFARTFGAELWFGIKFAGEAWKFVPPEDLIQTPTGYKVTKERALSTGLATAELLRS